MAVIGQILLWILWIVLGLLALVLAVLLVALLIPVRIRLSYNAAGFSAVLQILFFKKKLLPAEKKRTQGKEAADSAEKNKKPLQPVKPAKKDTVPADTAAEARASSASEAETNAKKPPHEPKRTKQNAGTGKADEKKPAGSSPVAKRILESLPELLGMAGRFVSAVLRSLRFGGLTVIVPVSGGAPDEVARKVGKANAWFYAIVSPLENTLHLKWKQVRIFPDYEDDRSDEMQLSGWVQGQLLPVAIAAIHLLLGLKRENIL